MIPRGDRYLLPSLIVYFVLELSFSVHASPLDIGLVRSKQGCKIAWDDPRSAFSWEKRTRDSNQINNEDNIFVDLCPIIGQGASTQVVDRIVQAGPDDVVLVDGDERQQGRKLKNIRYIFNFGDSSVEKEKGWEIVECSRRTRTCLTNNNARATLERLPSSAKQHGIDVESNSFVWTSTLDSPRTLSKVYIKCKTSLTEASTSPSFLAEERQGDVIIHTFVWESQYACARSTARSSSLHILDDGNAAEGEPEASPEEELVSPNQPSTTHVFKVLFLVGLTITALCVIIIYRPSILPAPLRPLLFIPVPNSPLKRFNRKIRRSPPIPPSSTPTVGGRGFRVGEDRLVRWAQEDLSVEGEGEIDTMVNGVAEESTPDREAGGAEYSYGYGYGAAGVGHIGAEYIPLKPSPFVGTSNGKSHLWGAKAGYGSVVIGR